METMVVGHQRKITDATSLHQTTNGLPDALSINALPKKMEGDVQTIAGMIRNQFQIRNTANVEIAQNTTQLQ